MAKWRRRTIPPADAPMGPRSRRTAALTAAEEAVVVEFRRRTLLPLDDVLDVLGSLAREPAQAQPQPVIRPPSAGVLRPRPLAPAWSAQPFYATRASFPCKLHAFLTDKGVAFTDCASTNSPTALRPTGVTH